MPAITSHAAPAWSLTPSAAMTAPAARQCAPATRITRAAMPRAMNPRRAKRASSAVFQQLRCAARRRLRTHAHASRRPRRAIPRRMRTLSRPRRANAGPGMRIAAPARRRASTYWQKRGNKRGTMARPEINCLSIEPNCIGANSARNDQNTTRVTWFFLVRRERVLQHKRPRSTAYRRGRRAGALRLRSNQASPAWPCSVPAEIAAAIAAQQQRQRRRQACLSSVGGEPPGSTHRCRCRDGQQARRPSSASPANTRHAIRTMEAGTLAKQRWKQRDACRRRPASAPWHHA